MADNLKDILLDKGPKDTKPKETSLKDILKSTSKTSQATDIQLGQFGVGESKYDIGVTPENVVMLEEVRGQRQPRLAKLGAGLANAVTQTGIDILKDASYLLDYENYTDFTKSSQEGFNNWLANSLQSAEEKLKLPVYRTKESEGFSPTSAGWWADNLPSIVSTVSMMIPAEAAVMGLSKVGKLLGGDKLIKSIESISGLSGISDAAKGITGAVVSRQMENIMEGGQTFEDTYNKAIEAGKSEDEAKVIAGEAAANNYKLNWANLATDIPQYMLLHKTFKQTLKDQQFSARELAKNIFQESAEEGYQFISNEEAKRAALVKHNVLADDHSSLSDRLQEYAKDGEFWTSVFLGGLGGGVFSGVAAYQNNKNLAKMEQQYDVLTKLHAATIKGDEDTFNRVSDEAFSNELIYSIKEDNLEGFKEMLDKTIEIPEDPTERLDTQKKINTRNETIKFAEELKTTLAADNSKSPELRALELNTSIDQHLTTARLQNISSKLTQIQAKDQISLQLVDPTLYQFKLAKLTYEAIKDIPSLQDKTTNYAKSIKDNYEMLSKEGISPEDVDKQLISIYDKELITLLKNKELDTKKLNENKDLLYTLSTPQGKEAIQKEVDAIKASVAKQKEEAEKAAKVNEQKAKETKEETLVDIKEQEEVLNKTKENIKATDPSIPTEDIDSHFEEQSEALNLKKGRISKTVESKTSIDTNSKDGVVPDLSNKEKKQLEENLEETLTNTTEDGKQVSPQGTTIYVGDKIINAATALAYLSKNYEEITFVPVPFAKEVHSKKDISENLNENMQEPLLLSPNYYQVGEELTLEVDKAFNVIKDDKTTLTYDMYKDDPDMVPIKVTNKDGKTIAYLHTTEWINTKNVADIGNNIKEQHDIIKALRREIVNGPKIIKITSKTFGKLSFTMGREDRRTAELIKAPVQFAIGKDNSFWTGLETPLSGNQPVNKKITPGLVYMIVPTPVKDKTVALPVFNTKVTSRIAETLANATEIFFTQDKEAANKIYDQLGIDLLTNRGLRDFFNLYVATNSFDQSDLNNAIGRDDKFFLDVIGNGIKYGTGGNNLRDIGDPRFWNKAEFVLDIQTAYISIFLSHMDKPSFKHAYINDAKEVEFKESTYPEFIKEYTTTNIVEQDLGNGEYSYFVQPVINFGVEKQIEQAPVVEQKTEEGTPSIGFPTELGAIDLDNVDIDEDYLPANLSTRQVDNIAKESSLISGFTAARQAQVLGVMNAYVLKELKSGKSKEAKEIYSSLKTVFEKYRDAYAAIDSEKAKYVSGQFAKILENYDLFTQQSAARLTFFNVKETSTGDLSGFEDFGSNNEKTNFDDGAIFQIDSKEGMSSKLKQFLSFVPSTKKNYLGLESYMPYDEVVNYLSGQLAGLDASYVDIATKLSELSITNPWVKTVKELLDSSPEQIKNEFVQWATKHYTGFKIVNLVKGPDDFTIKVMDSDQNSVTKLIQTKWLVNLKTSSLVKETTPGNLVIDNNARKALVDEITTLDKNDITGIKNWLSKLGIDVSTETLESLKNNTRLPIDKQFTDANGIFKTIIDNLSKATLEGDDSFESNNPLLNNSGIRKLAALEAKYSPAYFSNSFKNGEGKTIYSYSANKYFIKQFFKLKHNKDGYLNNLLKINFNSTSDWGKKLTNPNSYFNEVFDYFYVDTLKIKNDGTTLANMSSREHEVTKLGLFQNQNNGSDKKGRISNFLFPTMSDKSTMTGLTALKHEVNLRFTGTEYSIGKESIDAVFSIVEGEYNRIRASYNIENTIDGYNPNKFYFFEELNDNESLWLEEGNKKTLNPLTPERETLIKDIIEKHLRNLISAKLSHWEDLGLIVKDKLTYVDKTYLTAVKSKLSAEAKTNNTSVNTYMAADYVINYVIANANAFQLFIGDPAQFAKKTLDATWINIGKRLAGEIAPGLELADSKDNKYTQAFVNDSTGALRISKNYSQIEKLLGKEQADPYKDIDSTDAQEYTTLAEHLYVLEKSGKLSSEEAKALLEKEEAGKLSKKDLKTIFQPSKPVYVNTQLEPSLDLNRKIYIKSSSFPLVKGLSPELDKLRAQMLTQGVDRVAFKTATKVGGPKSFITIFNDNGTIKDDISFSNKMLLDREGFRLQQEVPFDETKEAINRGTQESKLLFANLLEVEGFEYTGSKLSGKQLQDKYNDLNKQLFENAKAELFRELDYNGTTLDIVKVQTMLMEEAVKRGWPQNDIDSLKLINIDKYTQTFAMPLWSSTSANRIEALLNSLVDNRIRKQKFRGKSFVLASEEGFIGKSTDIVYTKNYNPEKGLLPQRIVDGKVLPAQILITNNLRDINGKLINLSQFIGEDGFIDFTKIDEDLLKVFGFRIPTQGLNSMTYAEVVGFLPNYMGDLVITSKDYTKQMGSDFDIDKLYVYMYNTKKIGESLKKFTYSDEEIEQLYNEIKNKKLGYKNKIITEVFENPYWVDTFEGDLESFKYEFKQREVQNKILDIHFSVFTNPSEEVQKQILHPLGFGNLPELAAKVDKYRNKRNTKTFKPTRLSDTYQKDKYMKARGGKSGTGVKSLDSVFTAISQGKGLTVSTIDDDGKEKSLPLIFGDNSGKAIELYKISSKKSINGNPKLNTVAAYQSAAVDNEKEQILEKINSNNYTFDAERALAAVGYTEEFIVPLTSQDIIFEYADEMSRMQDSLNDKYISKPEMDVINNLIAKYTREAGFSNEVAEKLIDPDYPLTQKQMWDAIELGPSYEDYYKVQLWTLFKFNRARQIGKEISNIQLSINTDSSGVSPSLIESNFKEEKVDNIGSSKYIMNAENLLDNTINGYATENALRVANALWSGYFPYSISNVKNTFSEIQMLTGKEILTNDARYNIFNQMKSFVYSKDMGIGNVSERQNLFFDTPTNKSLATRVKELQKTSNNPFIQRLMPEPDITGTKPSLIKYNAGVAENLDELSVYQGFTDLFVNPTTRTLAQELVSYFYLSGGIQQAIQFGKYIPNAYLTNIGFADALRKINFNDESLLGINNFKEHYYDVSNFAKQWIQHNPGQAIKIDPELFQIKKPVYNSSKELIAFESDVVLGKDLLVQRSNPQTGESTMVLPEFVSLPDKKSTKKFRLFQYVGNGKYVQIDTLGTFGYSEYNQETTNIKSLVKDNQATPVEINKPIIDNIESKDEEVLNNKLPTDRVVEYGLNKSVKAAMEIITKSPNKLHAALAKEIVKKDLKIKVSIVDTPSVRGSFNYSTNTLTINPINIKSDSEFERVLLHETIHYLTGHTIRATNRTPEQDRIVKSLTVLQTAFKQKIESNPEWKAEFDAFVKAYEAKEGLDEAQISKNYGAIKLTEFVTMAMTDIEFQKILNDIPFTGQKTLLDRFIDLVKELLGSLGFPVKEDSILAHSIENIVELINLTNSDFVESEKSSNLDAVTYKWARRSENSYEVSSKGDKRFSALYAKLKDGRTIEEAYQLDIKGYRSQGNNWMLGKGKPPISNINKEDQWKQYKELWKQYLKENPNLFEELKEKASGKTLTDMFASTDISQARALAEILNESNDELPSTSKLPELKPCM